MAAHILQGPSGLVPATRSSNHSLRKALHTRDSRVVPWELWTRVVVSSLVITMIWVSEPKKPPYESLVGARARLDPSLLPLIIAIPYDPTTYSVPDQRKAVPGMMIAKLGVGWTQRPVPKPVPTILIYQATTEYWYTVDFALND